MEKHYWNLTLCLFLLPLVCCSQNWQGKEEVSRNYVEIDTYIEEYHKINGFSGAILIAKGNQVVLQKAIGWQDIENDINNSPDTRFNLGSGNKMFTAVAIAQLAEQGKLDYSTPIISYLPNYPDQDFASKATVHQLLTHSSGLGDFRSEEYKRNWQNLETLAETLPYVTSQSLKFEPGKGQEYSNSGFLLLGLIIEAVTGQNYFDYIRENIYAVAGMSHSDSYKRDGSVSGLAVPYQGFKNEWYEATFGLMGTSAGGGFSTIKDMLDFSKALYGNKLVSEESLKLLTTDKTPKGANKSWDYGYGFIVRKTNGTRLVGHGGRAAGVFFEYYYYPQIDHTFIMFSNADEGAPDVLFNKINEYLTDDQASLSVSNASSVSRSEVKLVPKPTADELVLEMSSGESGDSNFSRYLATSVGLINAIKTENLKAFNAFFADQNVVTKAANESMFNFMVDEAIPIKGKITQLHALSEPMLLRQSDYPTRVLVFHLEDGSPGSISFSLNQDGKVDYLSLFVHDQICPNRKTRTCNLVERKID